MYAIRHLTSTNRMDSSETNSKPPSKSGNENNKEDKHGNLASHDRNFFQPARVRCTFCPCDEVDRFLLDYGCYFLLPISVVFWIVFLMA